MYCSKNPQTLLRVHDRAAKTAQKPDTMWLLALVNRRCKSRRVRLKGAPDRNRGSAATASPCRCRLLRRINGVAESMTEPHSRRPPDPVHVPLWPRQFAMKTCPGVDRCRHQQPPPRRGHRLATRLRDVGVPCALPVVTGAYHGFDLGREENRHRWCFLESRRTALTTALATRGIRLLDVAAHLTWPPPCWSWCWSRTRSPVGTFQEKLGSSQLRREGRQFCLRRFGRQILFLNRRSYRSHTSPTTT